MSLILAIEPDRRQASQLKRLMKTCAGADLVLADTTELALEAIGDRIPDLVLVPALLSPQDDAALAMALRVIATAAHVQTLTIPVFATAAEPPRSSGGGVLGIWRRGRSQAPATEGCDPAVFAEQIAAYLAEAEAAREALTLAAREDDEYEARKKPPTPQVIAPAADAPPVDDELEPWTEAEQWTYTPPPEIPYVAARPEPAAAASEPATWSEPERPQPIAAAPLADPDEEWEPVTLSASAETEPVDGLDLHSFLAELEEPEHSPPPGTGVEEEPPDARSVASMPDARSAASMPDARSAASMLDARSAAPILEATVQPSAAAFTEDSQPAPKPTELWTALSLTPHRWPRLEGVLAEIPKAAPAPDAAVAHADAVVTAEIAAAQPAESVREASVAARAEGGRPEWLEMLDALRHDIERLRAQRAEAGVPAPGRSAPAAAPPPPPPLAAPAPTVHVQAAAAPELVVAAPAAAHKKVRAKKDPKDPRPVQDEWGFFDPTQCGFTALLAKLDEISDSNDETKRPAPPPAP